MTSCVPEGHPLDAIFSPHSVAVIGAVCAALDIEQSKDRS
jgi:hypothetical protein